MAVVYARYQEDIESLIKRFGLMCEKEGIISEIKKREYFLSPSEKRHQKDCKQKHLNYLNKLKRDKR